MVLDAVLYFLFHLLYVLDYLVEAFVVFLVGEVEGLVSVGAEGFDNVVELLIIFVISLVNCFAEAAICSLGGADGVLSRRVIIVKVVEFELEISVALVLVEPLVDHHLFISSIILIK